VQFEWDEEKNQTNIEKHGISFEQAKSIFDGFVITGTDDRFEYGEVREITTGRIKSTTIVVVVHTDRSGRCRIISAREANKKERIYYETTLHETFNA
jgi:uncharacterized DUF497 family protein